MLQLLLAIAVLRPLAPNSVENQELREAERVRRFVRTLQPIIAKCGGVASSRARQCICAKVAKGVRCQEGSDLVAFRGGTVLRSVSDVIVYSPTAPPTY